MTQHLKIGVARTRLTPPWGVELAGWGYYLDRTWERVRDDLAATALVIDDGKNAVSLVAVDLMYIDAEFTKAIRSKITAETGIPSHGIMVSCTHSHNAPTAAFARGIGEIDAAYVAWATRQAATAAILAWRQRTPARLRIGRSDVTGWTYNRTRPDGPVDPNLVVWRADAFDKQPIAAVVNFQAHPTVMMSLGERDVSRDAPGIVTDALETAVPGLTAMYLQGVCGDVSFDEKWNAPEVCHKPGKHIAAVALEQYARAASITDKHVYSASERIELPTRRWTREELERDREEGRHRLDTGDLANWRDNLGRVMVNRPDRLANRYGGDERQAVMALSRFAAEWVEDMLGKLDNTPETLVTEVQAVRIGEACLVANPAELFTTLALDIRRLCPDKSLMIACYANDSIGYLPDRHDIERRSYAAEQSPKFKGQFPFTADAGPTMVAGMLDVLGKAQG